MTDEGEGISRRETARVGSSTQGSAVDRFKFYNSLTGVVKSLENQYTIIDLRNDSYVSGKIVSVDGNMNVDMTDVFFYDARGKEHVFKNFFVHCRNIRYVHIPQKFNTAGLIEKQLKALSKKIDKKSAHTFKKVRAERQQKETLLSIYDQRKITKEMQ